MNFSNFSPLMVLSGVILNLLTIMVFCRQRMRKYCFSLSMICLAISDISVLVLPVLCTWLDDHVFKNAFINNTIWCNLHTYIDVIFSANSSWIIVLISSERWYGIYRPFKKSRKFTNARVGSTLVVIFILSLIVFLPLPFAFHRIVTDDNIEICQLNSERIYVLFGILSIILIYVIPSIILAILNTMIVMRLRVRSFNLTSVVMERKDTIKQQRSQSTKEQQLKTNTDVSDLNEFSIDCTSMQTSDQGKTMSTQAKNDRNLSISLVIVTMVFVILTFPFQGFWFYENLYIHNSLNGIFSGFNSTKESFLQDWINNTDPYFNTFKQATYTLKNMNYVINFFLYSAFSSLFREEFISIFTILSKTADDARRQMSVKSKKPEAENKDKSRQAIAELEFSIRPFSKENVKIRIESSNLKNLL